MHPVINYCTSCSKKNYRQVNITNNFCLTLLLVILLELLQMMTCPQKGRPSSNYWRLIDNNFSHAGFPSCQSNNVVRAPNDSTGTVYTIISNICTRHTVFVFWQNIVHWQEVLTASTHQQQSVSSSSRTQCRWNYTTTCEVMWVHSVVN